MIKEEFYFDSRDGESRIHAVRYTPDDGNVKGIVQVVHGMAEYVERYENLAEFLTARGILVTGEDHLGHGKSVAEGGTYVGCSLRLLLRTGSGNGSGKGCTSAEEDHRGKLSGGALCYFGTQYGFLYYEELSVSLR